MIKNKFLSLKKLICFVLIFCFTAEYIVEVANVFATNTEREHVKLTFEVDNLPYTMIYGFGGCILDEEKLTDEEWVFMEDMLTKFASTLNPEDINYEFINFLYTNTDSVNSVYIKPVADDSESSGEFLVGEAFFWDTLDPSDRDGRTMSREQEARGLHSQGISGHEKYFKDVIFPFAEGLPVYIDILPYGIRYRESDGKLTTFRPKDIGMYKYIYLYIPEIGEEPAEEGKVIKVYHKNVAPSFPLPQTFPAGTLPPYTCGDPVEVTSGAFIWEYDDLKIGGKHDLNFKRFYNSQNKINGSLGKGWENYFDFELNVDKENASFRLPGGESIPFAYDELEGIFKPSSIYQTDYSLSFNNPNSRSISQGTNEVYIYSDNQETISPKGGHMIKAKVYPKDAPEIAEPILPVATATDSENTEIIENNTMLKQFSVQPTENFENTNNNTGQIVEFVNEDGVEMISEFTVEKYNPEPEEPNFLDRLRSGNFDPSDKEFIIEKKDGTKLYFNKDKKITEITQNDEVLYSYEYDSFNRVSKVSGKYGAYYEFEYNNDESNKISKVTDYGGNYVTFEYDENDFLIKSTNADGDSLKYNYDENGNITSIIDFNNKEYITNIYDEESRVTEQYVADRGTMTFVYDENVTTYTDPNGNETKYYYNEAGQVLDAKTPKSGVINTFDSENRVTSQTDSLGRKTSYEYDEKGRQNKIIYPDGSFIETSYNSKNLPETEKYSDGTSVSYGYDNNNNVTSITDQKGNTESFTYNNEDDLTSRTNRNGKSESYSYDINGFLSSHTDSEGNETSYEYDKLGKLLKETSPNGNEISYSYTTAGKLISKTYPNGRTENYTTNGNGYVTNISDGDGNSTSVIRDSLGKVTSEKDYMGNETSYFYNAVGKLLKTTDPLGFSLTNTYDTNGNIITRQDKNLNSFNYEFDSENQLTYSSNGIGGGTKFSYDLNGRVTKLTDSRSASVDYEYDSMGRLIKETDPLGFTKTYSYDANGNLTTEKDENGRNTNYNYDKEDKLIKITEPDGTISEITYDSLGRVLEIKDYDNYEIKSSYDKDGNVISSTDKENNVTKFEYNNLDLLSKEIFSDNTENNYIYDLKGNLIKFIDQDSKINEYEYNKNNLLTKTTDPENNSYFYTYNSRNELISKTDGNGNTIEYNYDGNGNVSKIINPDGGIFTNEYNALGNITKSTDPENKVVLYNYDTEGNLINVTNRNNNNKEYTYDKKSQATTMTNEAGGKYEYTYTNTGEIKSVKDPLGGITTFTYDEKDRVIEIKNPLGYSQKSTYDSADNVTSLTDEKGVERLFEYSPNGNVTKYTDGLGLEYVFEYDSFGRVIKETDHRGNETKYIYNSLGEVIEKINPNGSHVVLEYDSLSRIQNVIDENGNETKYNYDANGNILKTINPDGSINQFEYDSMDRLTKLSLNRNDDLNLVNETQNTVYKYNKNGLMTEEINSVDNSKFFTYDGNGNLITQTDEEGYVTKYEYNPLDLVKKINYKNEKTSLFIYDTVGNLTELEDWNGKTSITNDLLGRVTEITDFNDRTVKHEFDGVSNRTSITYPDETLAKYEYDEENKITKVTDGGETTEYNYDTYGNLEETIYPNGEEIINSYDKFNQLAKTEEFLNTEKRQTTEYNYDLIGNITLENNSGINNIKKEYNYDIRNRLYTVKENEKDTVYSYDTLSNLIKEVTGEKEINYNYNSLNQLISKSDAENNYSYLYDKRGNLIQESKNDSVNRSFEYDSLNKLSKGINEEKDEIQYIYNGLGKRVQTIKTINNKHFENQNNENTNSRLDKTPEKISFRMDEVTETDTEVPTDLRTYISNLALVKQNETPEIVTDYVVDYLNLFSQPLVSYEKDSFETKYVYGYGKISKTTKDLENEFTRLNLEDILVVAPNIKIATEGLEKTYFHKNIIGTTTYVTDKNGKLITNQMYDSFGKSELDPEDLINLSGLEERTNYTGHSYDEILDSYFAQARIYEPTVKRFLAEDMVKDGLNWYSYTHGNPVNFIDPTGNKEAQWAYTYDESLQNKDIESKISYESALAKALKLTAAFEGGGVTGNFDGQGLSMGIFQFNFGQKSLQPLLLDMISEHPELMKSIFVSNYNKLDTILKSSYSDQMAWVKSINDNNGNIIDSWKKALTILNDSAEFNSIQMNNNEFKKYVTQTKNIVDTYNLKTERSIVLAFDIAIQNWSTNGDNAFISKILAMTNELDKLKEISDRVINKSLPKFQNDVKSRKYTIVNGSGTVHGIKYYLSEQYDISDREWY